MANTCPPVPAGLRHPQWRRSPLELRASKLLGRCTRTFDGASEQTDVVLAQVRAHRRRLPETVEGDLCTLQVAAGLQQADQQIETQNKFFSLGIDAFKPRIQQPLRGRGYGAVKKVEAQLLSDDRNSANRS